MSWHSCESSLPIRISHSFDSLPNQILQIRSPFCASKSEEEANSNRLFIFSCQQQLLLTAGLDKTLNLFHVDGQRNPKIQGVYLKDLPIYNANFARGGAEVILTGRRNYFYSYDITRFAICVSTRPERDGRRMKKKKKNSKNEFIFHCWSVVRGGKSIF